VDDEVAVLDALQNLLRKERKRWDMAFAVGAQEALRELERAPVDVIVSDMRMPGMDGAELLARVRDDYPRTARLVLSGHAEREAVLRVLPVAHQYLSKPCDVDLLRAAIERTCELQSLLSNDTIRQLVGRLEKLPSVPTTYFALNKATANPGITTEDIARIVEADPAMSVKVLQLVNSAYFGLARRIASISEAVSYLGVELLKGLALSAQIFSVAERGPRQFSIEQLQEESLKAARLARRFFTDRERAEEAFTAAIVHDIGTLVIALGLPKEYELIADLVVATGRPRHEIEKEQLGAHHGEIGGYLLGVWGLPFSIVETAALHHTPSLASEGQTDILGAVHIADTLLKASRNNSIAHPERFGLDLAFVAREGLTGELPNLIKLAERELRR
jgi:HD-like signal output (HDOD) protein